MITTLSKIIIAASTATMLIAACAPQASPTPTVDIVGTLAVEIASGMQTQTAGASSPTPSLPTASATPRFTETQSSPPTETPRPRSPAVVAFAGCYTGPGESYTLISNIDPSIRNSGRQVITILGMGNEPGWVVIRNPYFNNPCWIKLEYLDLDSNIDLTQFPIMTPGAP